MEQMAILELGFSYLGERGGRAGIMVGVEYPLESLTKTERARGGTGGGHLHTIRYHEQLPYTKALVTLSVIK